VAENDYALIVGLQNYPGLGDPKLGGPEFDALQFEKWVKCPNGGAVPADHIDRILSSDYIQPQLPIPPLRNTRPAEAEIVNVLYKLRDISMDNIQNGRGPRIGNRLYIYMSGHGISPTTFGDLTSEECALLMSDVDDSLKRVPRYHIAGNYVASWFSKNNCFAEVFLFMDCCRDNTQVPAVNMCFPPTGNSDETKRFLAYAAKPSRRAKEMIINGKPQGVFTRALLMALRGAAAVPDPKSPVQGYITFESLQSFLINNMRYLLDPQFANDPDIQEPNVRFYPDNSPKTVVIPAPVQSFPVTIEAIPGAVDDIVIYSSALKTIVQRLNAQDLPKVVALPREEYMIIAKTPDIVTIPLSVKGIEGAINQLCNYD